LPRAASQRAIAHLCGGKIMKQLGLGIIVAIGLTLPALGQGVNWEGIYQLNFAKSTFRGTPPVKSSTMSLVPGNTITAVGFTAEGKPYTTVIPFIVDGKPHQVVGNAFYDMNIYTQLDPFTISINRTKDAKVVQTGITIFNPESKTITTTIIAADGSYNYVLLYEKQ
jgi:hypothetical protein